MRVLLVDHDSESLETVTRAIRGVLELDCVTSKGDALLLLRQNTYDVLIACERCVDGSGLDLLGRTTRTAVPLKRIFAAPPERLQLLGPRLAPFKVQRTINYPIDLEELWLAIAQVTSGPNDETDGTIERVVLDERGIPSEGSVPRAPIPPRPPAPLSAIPMAANPAVAAAGRAAVARLAQPAPTLPSQAPQLQPPPLRAPPPRTAAPPAARVPAPPRSPSDTGRMRALATPPAPAPPMTATSALELAPWTPETPVDDFAEVAAQARFGVQQKAADDATRRKRQRLLAASGIAIVVAGAIVMLIEKFYDPTARAREQAIAAEIERMTEQQKVTDNLALVEINIENAIMDNDLDTARRELATLIEKSPDHPRREFLQASIDRAAELARLAPAAVNKEKPAEQTPAQAAVLPSAAERTPARPRAERQAAASERPAERPPQRTAAARNPPDNRESAPRVYGAPIGESPNQSLPLNAPINSAPVTTVRRSDNSFAGRTVEASDSAVGRTAPLPSAQAPSVQAPTSRAVTPSSPNPAGSAAAPTASVAPAPAPAPPPPIDVIPAKIVKRAIPVAPANIPRRTSGFVVVQFNIGVDGRVSGLEVLESEPRGVFDDAAQDAVRKWIYEPRKENGVAVESSSKARLVFEPGN